MLAKRLHFYGNNACKKVTWEPFFRSSHPLKMVTKPVYPFFYPVFRQKHPYELHSPPANLATNWPFYDSLVVLDHFPDLFQFPPTSDQSGLVLSSGLTEPLTWILLLAVQGIPLSSTCSLSLVLFYTPTISSMKRVHQKMSRNKYYSLDRLTSMFSALFNESS